MLQSYPEVIEGCFGKLAEVWWRKAGLTWLTWEEHAFPTLQKKRFFVSFNHRWKAVWVDYFFWELFQKLYMGVSKHRGTVVPPNHPFVHRVFHYFHHPFLGVSLFLVQQPYIESHVCTVTF